MCVFVGVYASVFSQSPWWKKPRPFLPDWPLRGRGHHQLCQPVKWPLQHTADYMECKTLEKCVWNIRVTCLKWQWVGGGAETLPRKGRTLTSDFVWRHCNTLKWAGTLSMAPTAVHLLGRIQAGWKDICFPQGQMKQNSQAFVGLPFGDEKKRQICCWVVVQWAHKYLIKTHRPVSLGGFCLPLMIRSVDPFGLNG